MQREGPVILSALHRRPSQRKTELAVCMSRRTSAAVRPAMIASSTYMLHRRPSAVRKHTISPEMPQAKAGAVRMPRGTPQQGRYGG